MSSVLDSDYFISIINKKQKSIIEQLDTNRTEQIKSNRSRLIPIIECVICGRQEIALRGQLNFGQINGKFMIKIKNIKCNHLLKYLLLYYRIRKSS